jgi:uncharacterized protein DUF3180
VKPTRPRNVALIAIVAALLAWLVVSMTFASLPLLPWTAVPALLLLALGEWMAGRNLRARLAGRGSGKPFEPTAVVRLAALAKASSAAAAALGGLAAGFLIYVAGSLQKVVPRSDALAAAGTVLAAAVLVAAALYLERCCRSPEPPDGEDSQRPGSRQADRR